MDFSPAVSAAINRAFIKTGMERNEYVTPEHFLYALCQDDAFTETLEECGGDVEELTENLQDFFTNIMSKREEQTAKEEEDGVQNLELSKAMDYMFNFAIRQAIASGKKQVTLAHMFRGMLNLKESHALYYLAGQIDDITEFFSVFQDKLAEHEEDEPEEPGEVELQITAEPQDAAWTPLGARDKKEKEVSNAYEEKTNGRKKKNKKQASYVTCLNDVVEEHNPLIGREEVLERTIQVLCCRDKNNPLHIGEAGVGKTSIAYGLAKLINEGNVPERLKDARVFMLDLTGIVAGTQYRGEFEKRLRGVMESLLEEAFPILYIDEIHSIMGAGDVSGGMDAAGLLKPYFENPAIRFMGSTTYDEYKKTISRNPGLLRRFQNIDVEEPDREQCIAILSGISEVYENHHHICYDEGFLEACVDLSTRYIHDRFLPDKAIGIMDETGAWIALHPEAVSVKTVSGVPVATKELAEKTVARICRIPVENMSAEDTDNLRTLRERMGTKIFGQEDALTNVTYAVSISRLGLGDAHKPVASLLFVGPTGVGKTETARVLAEELGISLVRFDMSEYTEKHTVAKLIGSPAGYVGYEEGGLLTEAVRKNPNCVLLLDEIEKAHSDIYNVLLQVMDYATLTDNHGKKTDFGHVILIMTSNAGVAGARQVLGFGDTGVAANDVMDEVKRVFSPEFRNRLSGIVMFRKLTREMGMRVVDKNLKLLSDRLAKRSIAVSYTDAVRNLLLKEGYSEEYGARELERVVSSRLNPPLVNAMLSGDVKDADSITLDADGEGNILISKEKPEE